MSLGGFHRVVIEDLDLLECDPESSGEGSRHFERTCCLYF
jgi:hypothetical protein